MPAAGGMRHLMLLCPTFRSRYTPCGSSRTFEHEARARTRLAQGIIEIADGFRPVGILVAVLWIADRLLDLDQLPVGIQFIGRHHWEGGANARTHLRAVRHDSHRASRLNAQVHTGVPWCRSALRCCRRSERFGGEHLRGEYQRSGGKHAPEKTATTDVYHSAHIFPPPACLMAWRMR